MVVKWGGGGLGAGVHSINISSSYPYFQRKEQIVLFLQTDTLARANVTCGTGSSHLLQSLVRPSCEALQGQEHCAGGQETVNLASGFQTEVNLIWSRGPWEAPP